MQKPNMQPAMLPEQPLDFKRTRGRKRTDSRMSELVALPKSQGILVFPLKFVFVYLFFFLSKTIRRERNPSILLKMF